MPYDFYVWTDGTYYYADDWRGNLVYGGFGGAGGVLGITTDTVFQAVVNTGSCKVLCSKGIFNFNLTSGQNYCVLLPYGKSYCFYGSGMPSMVCIPFANNPTNTTPSDGTQFRLTSSVLTAAAGNYAIFQRASGSNHAGNLEFYDCAFMLPYGSVTSGIWMYCVYDFYCSSFKCDRVLGMPYGWAEAGYPTITYHNVTQTFYIDGCGGGSTAKVGTLLEIGLYQGTQLINFDAITWDDVTMWKCVNGIISKAIVQNYIKKVSSYDPLSYIVTFSTNGSNQVDNCIETLFVECVSYVPTVTAFINLGTVSTTTAMVKRSMIFHGTGYAGTYTHIADCTISSVVTNVDATQLIAGQNWYCGIGGVTTWQVK
jgi:hypothetical protein